MRPSPRQLLLPRIRRPGAFLALVIYLTVGVLEALAAFTPPISPDGETPSCVAAPTEGAEPCPAEAGTLPGCCAVPEEKGVDVLKPGPPKLNYCGRGEECDCREKGRRPLPLLALLFPFRMQIPGSDEVLGSELVDGQQPVAHWLAGRLDGGAACLLPPEVHRLPIHPRPSPSAVEGHVSPEVPPPRMARSSA